MAQSIRRIPSQPPRSIRKLRSGKTATAHFLRQETRSKRESTSTIRALEKELDTHIFLLGDSPTQAALTTRERLLQKIKEAKTAQKRSAYHAYKSSQYQERMSKEFFQNLKTPSTRNSIVSLYITPDWEAPQNRDGSHTQDNQHQQIVHEIKYYKHLFQSKS
jgi:hypothetical protein